MGKNGQPDLASTLRTTEQREEVAAMISNSELDRAAQLARKYGFKPKEFPALRPPPLGAPLCGCQTPNGCELHYRTPPEQQKYILRQNN